MINFNFFLNKYAKEKSVSKINPFNLVYEQYKIIQSKLNLTGDPQEKNILFKRLANLLAVMEYLISLNKMQ